MARQPLNRLGKRLSSLRSEALSKAPNEFSKTLLHRSPTGNVNAAFELSPRVRSMTTSLLAPSEMNKAHRCAVTDEPYKLVAIFNRRAQHVRAWRKRQDIRGRSIWSDQCVTNAITL